MTDTTNTVRPLTPATKRCWKCETTKATDTFAKDLSRPDGLQPICRPCAKVTREARKITNPGEQRAAYKKWYSNPENRAKNSARTVIYNRQRADTLIARFKSSPCLDCKQTFPTYCMDFDHRPGVEKLFTLTWRNMHSRPLEALMDEMAKCDLVCANCHRIRTVTRGQTGRKVS